MMANPGSRMQLQEMIWLGGTLQGNGVQRDDTSFWQDCDGNSWQKVTWDFIAEKDLEWAAQQDCRTQLEEIMWEIFVAAPKSLGMQALHCWATGTDVEWTFLAGSKAHCTAAPPVKQPELSCVVNGGLILLKCCQAHDLCEISVKACFLFYVCTSFKLAWMASILELCLVYISFDGFKHMWLYFNTPHTCVHVSNSL